MNFLREFIRFSRLHTIVGTTLSIVALYLLAYAMQEERAHHFGLLALTLLSCLGANVYIVGLNQLTDVAIDRINKPYLPLASGAFSMSLGRTIVFMSVLLSLAIAFYLGRYLLLTVLLSLALGTAYSLPPFRLKRFYFWAAFCIIAVRGLIVNLLLFLHFHYSINGSQQIPLVVWLLTAVIFLYSIVIAWFKDIPDMEGDQRYGIRTLSLRLGARQVFRVGNGLISFAYLGLIFISLWFAPPINNWLLVITHLLMFAALWTVSAKVNVREQTSIAKYYQFIWILFFLEYITFALSGLL